MARVFPCSFACFAFWEAECCLRLSLKGNRWLLQWQKGVFAPELAVILSQHHLFPPSGDDFEGKFILRYYSGFDTSFVSCYPQAHPILHGPGTSHASCMSYGSQAQPQLCSGFAHVSSSTFSTLPPCACGTHSPSSTGLFIF